MTQPPVAEMVPTRYAGARRRFYVGDFEKVTVQADLMVGVSTNVVLTVKRCATLDGEPDALPTPTTITMGGARSKATGILDVSGFAEIEVQVTTAEGTDAWINIGVRGQFAANIGGGKFSESGIDDFGSGGGGASTTP